MIDEIIAFFASFGSLFLIHANAKQVGRITNLEHKVFREFSERQRAEIEELQKAFAEMTKDFGVSMAQVDEVIDNIRKQATQTAVSDNPELDDWYEHCQQIVDEGEKVK